MVRSGWGDGNWHAGSVGVVVVAEWEPEQVMVGGMPFRV